MGKFLSQIFPDSKMARKGREMQRVGNLAKGYLANAGYGPEGSGGMNPTQGTGQLLRQQLGEKLGIGQGQLAKGALNALGNVLKQGQGGGEGENLEELELLKKLQETDPFSFQLLNNLSKNPGQQFLSDFGALGAAGLGKDNK